MLRALHTVLLDLQEGFEQMAEAASRGGVCIHLTAAEMTLPMDIRFELREGGCQFLADVQRQRNEDLVPPARLAVNWTRLPTALYDGVLP